MKFCSQCGKEIMEEAIICPNCGCAVEKNKDHGDSSSVAWSIVAFLFPLLGVIFYLFWKDDRPLRSKSIVKGLVAILISGAVIAVLGILAALSSFVPKLLI